MILVCLQYEKYKYLQEKYKDKVNVLNEFDYKMKDGKIDTDFPINFLENLKLSQSMYEVTIVNFSLEMLSFIDAIKLDYYIVYNSDTDPESITSKLYTIDKPKIHLCGDITLDKVLSESLTGFNLEEDVDQGSVVESVIESNSFEELPDKFQSPKCDESNVETKDKSDEKQQSISILPENKNKLTLQELVNNDVEITDTDVRELKTVQNKIKVGLLLQGKSMLNRVLKLSTILDKLYDKLLERIDESLDTADTSSIMYTAEYINRALSDTNNFMTSLINNDKIQNFFIVDNSTVINTSSDDRVSIDSRERVRKAAEIVLDNIDYFASGQFDNLKNPNIVEVVNNNSEEDNNKDVDNQS